MGTQPDLPSFESGEAASQKPYKTNRPGMTDEERAQGSPKPTHSPVPGFTNQKTPQDTRHGHHTSQTAARRTSVITQTFTKLFKTQ